jgi:hypothetical protein
MRDKIMKKLTEKRQQKEKQNAEKAKELPMQLVPKAITL